MMKTISRAACALMELMMLLVSCEQGWVNPSSVEAR